MKTDKILIVVDESPASVKAIQYGFKLASDLEATVLLINVVEPSLAIGNPDAGIFPDDALGVLKTNAEALLNRLKDKYAGEVPTTLSAPIGHAQSTIIDTAVKWGAGLIVVGAHAHSALGKLFRGDISESIMHHSPVPVCVVP
jgi:nucleotide-binding universal stress UspA family protein